MSPKGYLPLDEVKSLHLFNHGKFHLMSFPFIIEEVSGENFLY